MGIDKKDLKNMGKFLNSADVRIENLMQDFINDVSEDVLANVEAGMPQEKEFESYKDSLEIKDVNMVDPNDKGVSIVADPDNVNISNIDGNVNIIHFKPIAGQLGNLTDYGKFIVQNSPFAIGIVERIPSAIEVVFEKVSMGQVADTREENLKIINKLVALRKPEKDLSTIEDVTANMGLMVLRSEFGAAGYKAEPHWRPAIKNATKKIKKYVETNVKKHLDHKKNPPLARSNSDDIEQGSLQEFDKFQKSVI